MLRAVVAGLGTSLALLVVTLAVSRGWRPPPTLAPLDVAALPAVSPSDRHLPYAFVDRSDTTVDGRRARVVRPRGAEGTLPGVALVAGAGRTTRDELADEAEALARGGLVVLTYDKPPQGSSVLRRDYGALAHDALRALDVVARQPQVDPERLGLLGFSEGGWVVPIAAARAPGRVAFTILVSAPVVSPLEQAAWVVDRRLDAAPEGVRSSAATLVGTGRPLLGSLGTDVRGALAASARPVYAVWGAADPTVPVAVAVDRLRAATGDRGSVELVGGAGHRVPLASGWAERASDWVRRGYPGDDVVRGTQPDSRVGLPTLPRQTRLGDPRLHLVLTALAALVAAAWPVRRQGSGLRVRTSSRRG